MKRQTTAEKIGKCLTRYSHSETNDFKATCVKFVNISQFENTSNLTQNDIPEHKWQTEPKCYTGSFLYGLTPSGELVEIESIIDSSD